MANRCYLYSCNVIPGENDTNKKLIGISEFNYDIPLVFKILLSANPNTCLSSIWNESDHIAIAGDYNLGVKKLTEFLSKIKRNDAQPLINDALKFLNNPENKSTYFILEAGEIFELSGEDFAELNLDLLNEIKNIESTYISTLSTIESNQTEKISWVKKLFKNQNKQENSANQSNDLHDLGLGYWSNTLYFDFSSSSTEENRSQSDDPVLAALIAMRDENWDAIEDIRFDIAPEHIPDLLATWDSNMPWPVKDSYVVLLMDQSGDILEPIMKDALNSPTVESRGIALSILLKDTNIYSSFITDGWVDPEKVDAAIKKFMSTENA